MNDKPEKTFYGYPYVPLGADLKADIAIFGAPHGTPYFPGKISHCVDAPAAIRHVSGRNEDRRHNYDFDWGGAMPADAAHRIVDCGDVAGDPADPEGNREAISSATKQILEAGAVPVLLGGDDSVPIPFLKAFGGQGPIWIVQVDAHLDWRDERNGERLGWSSTMRRISEMEHVEGMVQVGLRGIGSALEADVQDARDWGSHLVSAATIHTKGVDAAVSLVPEGAKVIVTFDVDGLEPSHMPGVLTHAPGGLTYTQAISLIHGLSERAKIAGFDLVELMPERDPSGLSALTAHRIVANSLTAILRGMPDRYQIG